MLNAKGAADRAPGDVRVLRVKHACSAILCCTVLCYTVLCNTLLYSTLRYYTIL